MGHKAHVRLVDAHTKGNRRHHDHPFLAQKARLIDGTLLRLQAGMVRQGVNTVLAQKLCRVIHSRARQTIHNPCVPRMLFLNKIQQLFAHLILFNNAVANIRAVKAGHKVAGFFQLQALGNFYPRQLSGGGRQGNPWHTRPTLGQQIQAQIFRAEVVAPLRYAVGFIDGEQGNLSTCQQIQTTIRQQTLGSHIQQIQLPGQELAFDLAGSLPILGGVQISGVHTQFVERIHLILHQGNQGGNHHAGARSHQCRNLVTERLAAACGHQDQGVTALDQGLDNLVLRATKTVITKNFLKNLKC